jgi:hypothetical protein
MRRDTVDVYVCKEWMDGIVSWMGVCALQDEEELGERVGLGNGGEGANENGMRCLFVYLCIFRRVEKIINLRIPKAWAG